MTALQQIRYKFTPTSWIDEFALPDEQELDFERIWNIHPEEYGKVKIYGKVIETPRWQQTYGRSYRYSGMDHKELPIPTELQEIYKWVNDSQYGPFNQMLVNWYQNGHHYIGKHRDDESDLIPDAPIMSISLGATRVFRLRNYSTNEIVKDVTMPDGTVLVMGGTFNTEFTHEVPKINGGKGLTVGRRINITFRLFQDS